MRPAGRHSQALLLIDLSRIEDSFTFHLQSLGRHFAEEAALVTLVAGSTADLLNLDKKRVSIAVDIDGVDLLDIAAFFPFAPEFLPAPAVINGSSRFERLGIRERLYHPLLWAEELGIELLLETHGVVTDTVSGMGELLDALGHEKNLGVCLDTGNSWLGGAEPLDYIKAFGNRIKHVHWKDMGPEWLPRRGTLYGCGMATIALGEGVIDVPAIVQALLNAGFDGATTLEIAGPDNVRRSIERLECWARSVVPPPKGKQRFATPVAHGARASRKGGTRPDRSATKRRAP